MKLLIIGGTRFVGRHLVTAALARGHEVTLFNRGRQSAPLEGVETIQGDRFKDPAKLQGRSWDAVVDMPGLLPWAVRASAEVLRDAVELYVFVSSVSVYADVSAPGIDESAPMETLSQEQLDRANAIDPSQATAAAYGDLYGGLKTLCEQAVEEVMPQQVLILRPGLIAGSHDYTDRFTYWVARVARGGEVLAPGRRERHVQFIDARDLAEWTISMIERKQTGVYNCTNAPGSVTMGQLLGECKTVSGSDASFTWVDEDFLAREQVRAWSEVPLWLPESEPGLKGFMYINCDKAIEAGLTFRPVAETVSDTLAWQEMRAGEALKAGLDPEKEQRLLAQWHAVRGS